MYPIGTSIEGSKENTDKKIEGGNFDEERSFYGCRNIELHKCKIDGPKDGESAFKEGKNICLVDCDLNLRYPLWHTTNVSLENCREPDTCRASLWYIQNVTAKNCEFHGIKAFRECNNISLDGCDVQSEEFMWKCDKIEIKNSKMVSVYPFLMCKNMVIENSSMTGKYAFQYTENLVIKNSYVNTKDAFWHSVNVTVYDSVVAGEYLGWYSKGLKLIRCKIEGTQPLCYAGQLVLEDCEMVDTDLAFELSDVNAKIKGNILSVKNPLSGRIEAESIDQIIQENDVVPNSSCEIVIKK